MSRAADIQRQIEEHRARTAKPTRSRATGQIIQPPTARETTPADQPKKSPTPDRLNIQSTR